MFLLYSSLVLLFLIVNYANSAAFDFDQCLLSDTIAQHISTNWADYTLKYIEYNPRNRGLKKSYNGAVDLCKFCYGGHVITDTANLPRNYFPTWLGLSRKAGRGSNWEWSNGSMVDTTIVAQRRLAVGLKPDVSYGIVTDISKWYPIEADKIFSINSEEEEEDEEEEEVQIGDNNFQNIKGVVCRHVRRPACEIVNYTDAECVYSKQYGCHRYVSTVIYEPDDHDDNCTKPKHIRFAEQCSKESCMCNVTQWSTWSPCTAKTCMDGMGKRNRQRAVLSDPPCTSDLVKPRRLAEEQQCSVVGCRGLRNELLEEVEGEEESNENDYSIF